MKRICLTQNKVALVDDEIFEFLNQWKWCFSHGYAQTRGRGKKEYMHRIITRAPFNKQVDHINSDGLDNRSIKRLCNPSDNQHNRSINRNNKSGYKNIFKNKKTGKWQVTVMSKWKNYHGGFHNSIQEAVDARDKLQAKLHGEYARSEI